MDRLPACPLSALAAATKPVEITYWHAMTRANEDELKKLTNAFNAQQHDVHVTLSAAASYTDNFTRFKAGLSTGVLPDLMQGDDTSTQAMIDSQAVLPAASCIAADHASTSDLIPRVVAYYSVKGVLWPMPFNNSNPVLYYNEGVREGRARSEQAAGDARRRQGRFPADRAQLGPRRSVSRSRPTRVYFEHWLAKAGHTLVNNGNGRTARATAVTFDDPTGISLFQWIDDMVTSKLALSTGTSDLDHYLAVANGRAAMTIDTSAALGTIAQLFAAGQYENVQLGVGPMPGPTSPDGGVLVGGAANYIVNRSSPAKQAAAYEFAKYLASPRVQSEWAAATGYTPVSASAALDGAARAEVRAAARVQGRIRPAPRRRGERSDGRSGHRRVRRQGGGCARRHHRRHREGRRSAVDSATGRCTRPRPRRTPRSRSTTAVSDERRTALTRGAAPRTVDP